MVFMKKSNFLVHDGWRTKSHDERLACQHGLEQQTGAYHRFDWQGMADGSFAGAVTTGPHADPRP